MKYFIEFFFRRFKLCFSILFIIILLMVSYLVYINNDNSVKASSSSFEEISDVVKNTVSEIKDNKKIKVDVKGLVVNPGVYELEEGSRVIDAIEAAGWVSDDANLNTLNLSMILKDENVIIVGSKKEEEIKYKIEYVYKECTCPEYNNACINDNSVVNYKEDSGKQNNNDSKEESGSLISLNSASKDELQTLSGVGESKALAIIKYREENGPFTSIDEIKNVSGIGDALFEKIKDNITI